MQGRETVRLTVYRSAKHIYAQLVDPVTGRTLVTASSRAAKGSGESAEAGRIEAARRVGKTIAELARERGIAHVVFNRNGFLYHGRVKALGEAAREAGLNF
jgi:large subunit ribosomal protein L18